MVRRWNHLRGSSLQGRRILYVHLPVAPAATESRRLLAVKSKSTGTSHSSAKKPAVRHTVKPGETLSSIASTHHTTIAALKRDNGNLAALQPGMVLIVRGPQ
jgi:LysM repeat protein